MTATPGSSGRRASSVLGTELGDLVDVVGTQLRDTIGLDVGRIGRDAVARAIDAAWPDAAAADSGTVAARLAADTPERRRLLEAIVVSESWFLREPRVFAHAASFIQRRLREKQQAAILSVPCAAGEEAYSLAMSLLEAGIDADRFRIVAADLSPRAIAAARAGVATENAFRGGPDGFRDRWFSRTAAGWAVAAALRRPIVFLEENLLDPAASSRLRRAAGGSFDLICCRNLLIYLTAEARQQVEKTLGELLSPGGEVIVGAAEAVILPVARWQPAGPLAFGRRQPATGPAARPSETPGPRRLPRLIADRSARPRRPRSAAVADSAAANATEAAVAPAAARPSGDPLAAAETLANKGDIAAAIAECRRALQADPAQPELLFLQALLQQSIGADTTAERLLEKVVYLEPNHEAALLALALAARRRGDSTAERRYRRRAALAAESAP